MKARKLWQNLPKFPKISPKFWTQVHAAIELLDLAALAKLLNEEARFHFGRKLTDSEVNMLMKIKMVLVSR